jgi:aminoglycoside phosphotransferase (APT) family kinase protein
MSSQGAIAATDLTRRSRLLLEYLRRQTGVPGLEFSEPPERLTGGYDAAIFGFRVSAGLAGPLVLRLFGPDRSAQLTLKEAAVQNALAAMGYPAPSVRSLELDSAVLGGPFLIMDRLPGRPLAAEFESLRRSRNSAVSLISTIRNVLRAIGETWDTAQSRLHDLEPNEFLSRLEDAGLSRDDVSLEHAFLVLRRVISETGFDGFAPGLAWLDANRRKHSAPSVICHGDLQPLNVLADEGAVTGVLDWGSAVIAHPALDYGAALAILATVPIAGPPIARPFIRAMMNGLARRHARPLLRQGPGGAAALRYFAAYNCLSQLVWVAFSCRRNNGLANLGAYDSVAGVRNLTQQFRAYTGVRLDISLPEQAAVAR